MGRRRAACVSCLVVALLAPAALADVLVVAPSGAPFTQIQDAVFAAQPGDIVLVKSGSYGRVHIFESVSIVADKDATVIVNDGISIGTADASTTIVLRGLTLPAPTLPDTSALLVNALGSVHIERCSFTGTSAPSSFFAPWASQGARVWSSEVTFAHCTFVGGAGSSGVGAAIPDHPGAAGLSVLSSNVSLWQCSITGGAGGDGLSNPATLGGPGMTVHGGLAVVDGCTVAGGTGGTGALGIVGAPGAQGGEAVFLYSGLLRHTDTTFSGGAGGAGGPGFSVPGPAGSPGAPVVVVNGSMAAHADAARDFTVDSPVRSGDVASFEFGTVSCDAVLLLYSVAAQPLWLGGPRGRSCRSCRWGAWPSPSPA